MYKAIRFIVFIFFHLNFVFGQVSLNLKSCDSLFIRNNLLLLAGEYDVSAAKAAVVQAKIWDLPVAYAEFNAVNPSGNRYFDAGAKGQKAIGVSQLIYLGGKKREQVAFAKGNQELAELEYEDLIRNLRYKLHQTFFTLYFDQRILENIDSQVSQIDTLLRAYEKQSIKGNVSMKDVVRLQALLLELKNSRVAIQNETFQLIADLTLLTGSTEAIRPETDEAAIRRYAEAAQPMQAELVSAALEHNPSYLSAVKVLSNQELWLRYQRTLRVPNLNTGIAYDQRGGAFANQVNLTFAMPLPLWNQNRGNIEMAKAWLEQAGKMREAKEAEIRNQVQSSYMKWNNMTAQIQTVSPAMQVNLETVYQGILANFYKSNISLFEFTDFMESYYKSVIDLNEMKKQLILSAEELQYHVCTNLFP